MPIHTFNYSLSEVIPDMNMIARLIGNYRADNLPEPYPEIIKSELEILHSCCNIKGGYKIVKDFTINQNNNILKVDNIQFNPGYQVIKHLKNAEKLVFYICTAGEGITIRSKLLFDQGLFLEGYITDLLGSLIVNNAMDLIHKDLETKYKVGNSKVTNRYSPGYCNWNVAEQYKLFALFPKGFCGVTLTDSALMNPVKSVSGIIGIGKTVKFSRYICNACGEINCIFRNIRDL